MVIDSGLARVPRFEPDVGVTRLETVRVSRAAADQRRGRAGRTGPGVCYRLWDERQTQSLPAFAEPEIRSADLAGLLLDCADWGATDPRTLSWIDPPSAAAIDAARAELTRLEALDADGRITAIGRRLRSLPLPPRLARMVIAAAGLGQRRGGRRDRRGDRGARARRQRSRSRRPAATSSAATARAARATCAGWRRAGRGWRVRAAPQRPGPGRCPSRACWRSPTRSASARRGARSVRLWASSCSPTAAAPISTRPIPWRGPRSWWRRSCPGRRRPRASCSRLPPTRRMFVAAAGQRIRETEEIELDEGAAALRARRVRRLDAIVLTSAPRAVEPTEETSRLLAEGIARLGVARLPWSKAQLQLRDRVGFLRAAGGEDWPDLSDVGPRRDGRGVARAVSRRQDQVVRDRRRRPRRRARGRCCPGT